MKRLLVATDLSARSDRALDRALDLSRTLNAELTIVHVVDDDQPASMADAQKSAAEAAIRDHVARIAPDDSDRITTEVVFGKAYVEIIELTEKIGAEFIVVGMRRNNGAGDLFRGTTVERIIRASTVPVLLVRDRADTPYANVMVGVDFSVYSRRAVEFAVRLVPSGAFRLVHAYDVPFKGFLFGQDARREISKQHEQQFKTMIDEEMATFLGSVEAKPAKLERIMQMGTVQEVIQDQTSRLKPDLLVIGTHGRTGVAHAFLGSIAEDLLRDPPCDVLAVKAW